MDEKVIVAFYRVHRAGPRKEIYYEPEEVKAAIVTCGGLCPGLNDVIRQVWLFYSIAQVILHRSWWNIAPDIYGSHATLVKVTEVLTILGARYGVRFMGYDNPFD